MIDDKLNQKQIGRYLVEESKSIRKQQQETPDRLDDNRERNIVIHGLEEETEMTDKERIDEIFKTTNTESCPIAF